ncbi:endo-N-acetyl-beta-D-glucosaminidase precursor [Purpureocillium lavendulum]|uniref:Endo-N-acetyl-beta-D-glucosaminidase n=1 Tax=Purpureocillium lavendulum TaxID=1247861 RepID=A0AB34FU55_9HYPO|nr:endo-N-acetyl-beta-D-glucosaminidase precursor [Purpureocillium lavendulum]
MKNSGVTVMGMVGGAASGSFTKDTLDGDTATFNKYYGQLKTIIQQFGLQGMDLDVEQYMSQSGITRLVNRLHDDFGSDFTITLAPVASALRGGSNLSGFDYSALETSDGSDISFYNAQFYSGFGTMSSPNDFNSIVARGLSASRIVAGQLTSRANGNGYIPYDQLNSTIVQLRNKYGQIGGVMGWEYFNSEPGGTSKPWEWAEIMTEILRPGQARKLHLSSSDVQRLQRAYRDSVLSTSTAKTDADIVETVNYTALANI